MSIVATITTDGNVLSFDKFLTPDGRVPDVLQTVEEELVAPGVDGRRFRDVSNRYLPFTADVIETVSTYTAAVTRARIYDRMIGNDVRLVVSNLAGASYTYVRVHVIGARARAVPGVVAGSAAGASHAAHIDAQLTLVVMQVTTGQNP